MWPGSVPGPRSAPTSCALCQQAGQLPGGNTVAGIRRQPQDLLGPVQVARSVAPVRTRRGRQVGFRPNPAETTVRSEISWRPAQIPVRTGPGRDSPSRPSGGCSPSSVWIMCWSHGPPQCGWQSCRRFAALSIGPGISSLVLISCYLAFVPLNKGRPLAGPPLAAELVLPAGTTLGIAVCERLEQFQIAEYLLWLGSLVLALDEYRSFNSERPRLRTFTIRAAPRMRVEEERTTASLAQRHRLCRPAPAEGCSGRRRP